MKHLLKAKISILLVHGIVSFKTDLIEVKKELKAKFHIEYLLNDVEDCLIELEYENEVEKEEGILQYLETIGKG